MSLDRAAERFIHTNFLARQQVRRKSRKKKPLPLSFICMGVTLLLCAFAFLWVRIYVLELGYRISAAHDTHNRLLQENGSLKIKHASLSAPSRIERIAVSTLDMKTPEQNQVITLSW